MPNPALKRSRVTVWDCGTSCQHSSHVGIIANMKAVELVRTRATFSETAFAELVLWQVPKPVAGSTHAFKYRLAYVVDGICVVRYDNEVGKGDHRHFRWEGKCLHLQDPRQAHR